MQTAHKKATLALSLFVPVLAFSTALGAQTAYSISLPCGQVPCLAYAMNDEGAAGGFLERGGAIFVAYPDRGLIQLDSGGSVTAINNSGVVVGSNSANQPFAFLPQTSTTLNLGGVFGWSSGTAVSINDSGEIVGNGNISLPWSFLPGLNGVNFVKINNAGQIVGTYLDAATNARDGFLYTPGQPLVTFPAATPVDLNDSGQVLLFNLVAPSYPGEGGSYFTSLYTPGQDTRFVYGQGLFPQAMDNSGDVLLNLAADFNAPPSIWTPAGGVVPLTLPATSGYVIWQPRMFNRNNQILAWVYNLPLGTGSTSVILTPLGAAPAGIVEPSAVTANSSVETRSTDDVSRARPEPGRTPVQTGCWSLTLNSRRIC